MGGGDVGIGLGTGFDQGLADRVEARLLLEKAGRPLRLIRKAAKIDDGLSPDDSVRHDGAFHQWRKDPRR
jgi:hypothetical protein